MVTDPERQPDNATQLQSQDWLQPTAAGPSRQTPQPQIGPAGTQHAVEVPLYHTARSQLNPSGAQSVTATPSNCNAQSQPGQDCPKPVSAQPPETFRNVAVIGLGLIGGSMALRAQQRGFEVTGYDAAPENCEAARRANIAVSESIGQAVQAAELVVLAVPMPAMAQVATEVAQALSPGATVIDIGSVKATMRAAIEGAGLRDYYIGTHPMAGNERSGFAAANSLLLVGAPWVLTTSPHAAAPVDGAIAGNHAQMANNSDKEKSLITQRYNLVFEFLTNNFAASVIELSDDLHDKAQALASGLPHIMAVQLLNQAADSPLRHIVLKLAAGSFRDGTRVARTDPDRTMALITENRAEIAALLRETSRELADLAAKLERPDDVSGFFHHADPLR